MRFMCGVVKAKASNPEVRVRTKVVWKMCNFSLRDMVLFQISLGFSYIFSASPVLCECYFKRLGLGDRATQVVDCFFGRDYDAVAEYEGVVRGVNRYMDFGHNLVQVHAIFRGDCL